MGRRIFSRSSRRGRKLERSQRERAGGQGKIALANVLTLEQAIPLAAEQVGENGRGKGELVGFLRNIAMKLGHLPSLHQRGHRLKYDDFMGVHCLSGFL